MPRSLTLFILWLALWGEASIANVLSGAVVVSCVTWLFGRDHVRSYTVKPIPTVRLVGSVLVSLVGSSARVVRAVFSSDPLRVQTSIQTVQLRCGSVLVGAVVANSITLTPGTMTLDFEEDTMTLVVHVLGDVDPSAFEDDILRLERLVANAFVVKLR